MNTSKQTMLEKQQLYVLANISSYSCKQSKDIFKALCICNADLSQSLDEAPAS